MEGFWEAWRLKDGYRFGILWAEMVAVEMGLRLAASMSHCGFWEFEEGKSSVLVRSDNTRVVNAIRFGRASLSTEENLVLKRIATLQLRFGIRLVPEHVPGKHNIADALSRGRRGNLSLRRGFELPVELKPFLIPL